MNKIPIFIHSTPTLPIFRQVSLSSSKTSKKSFNASSSVFPVHRIYCVGRNYREHAIEMGGNPNKEPPFFFMKPNDAIVDTATMTTTSNQSTCFVPYPSSTSNLHYEGELVVAIGKDIPPAIHTNKLSSSSPEYEKIMQEYIYGYAIGCDLTRRDLQSKAKETSKPWDASKGFDSSAPCGPIIPKEEINIQENTSIRLYVNNTIRQESTVGSMTWNIPDIICHLSKLFHVKAGDLIMTGTPAGVGKVGIGDFVHITCGDLPPCVFTISDMVGSES